MREVQESSNASLASILRSNFLSASLSNISPFKSIKSLQTCISMTSLHYQHVGMILCNKIIQLCIHFDWFSALIY